MFDVFLVMDDGFVGSEAIDIRVDGQDGTLCRFVGSWSRGCEDKAIGVDNAWLRKVNSLFWDWTRLCGNVGRLIRKRACVQGIINGWIMLC